MILSLLFAVATPVQLPVCAHIPTQAAINACADARYRQADTAMGAQWKLTLAEMRHMDRIDPAHGNQPIGYADALLAAQRAWLQYRDAECIAQGMHFAGGSAQPGAVAACKAALSTERADQLRTLAK